jgi:cyclopropane-fatty-acyl-phospholipid synthase
MFERRARQRDWQIARPLRPGGLVLNHGITQHPGQHELGSIGEFISYVFPGGSLPTSRSSGRAVLAGARVLGWRACGRYAKTLWHWVERLEANRAAALAAVGEKLYRIWRIYMAGSALGFERGWMSVYQVLAGKPLAGGALEVPQTRDYIYAR